MSMSVSYNPLHQNWRSQRSGHQFMKDEMECILFADSLGFDAVSPPEHHFDEDYSACPDNFMTLTYVAAKTERMKLQLSAIILPWNDMVRVVEKLSVLDHLSDGRAVIGFGRGLAKLEYDFFQIPMDESRQRFDEGWKIVIDGVRNGYVEADTEFYKIPRTPIVPTPRPELADRYLSVGMSPESSGRAGEIGAELLMFITGPPEAWMPLVEDYRAKYRLSQNGATPPAPHMVDFYYLHEDADVAREKAALYAGRYYESVVRHYSFSGEHFQNTKGYEAYAAGAQALRDAGMEAATQAYLDAQAGLGTPEQVIEKFRARMEVSGPFHAAGAHYYGGMTVEEAKRSMTLFAKEVLPELRSMYDEFAAKQEQETPMAASAQA
jgi:alkanesulfonate monooxygenase SsuD/methylene tetrahydromethanopterin reductase-like flavin-dependent oxidoreductase (luciferase family)